MVEKPWSEADVLSNRSSIRRAQSRRLLESWFPDTLADTASSQKFEQNDDAALAVESDLLGVAATMPHDTEENSLTRLQHARDEQLRKILMNTGKNKLEKDTSKRTQHASTKPMQKNGTVGLKRATDKVSSDEDDEGRASAFRSKRNKTARNSSGPLDYSKNGRLATKPSGKEGLVSTTLDVEKDGGSDDDEIFDKELPAAQRKHDDQNKSHRFPNQPAASYLDEVLRQSAEKRQRKKKKKDKRQRQSP